MGWLRKLGSGRVQAVYRDLEGSQRSATFGTRREAREFLAAAETDLRSGRWVDPRGGDVLLSEWIEAWLEGRSSVKASTAATDASRLAVHVLPSLGSHRLRDLTPLTIRRWVAGLSAALAPKTVRNCHGLLFAVLADAVGEGFLRTNPCAGTPLPEVPHAEMTFLTHEQVDSLLKAVDQHYRPLLLTLVGTGLRWGEAAGLRAGRVDLAAGHLAVSETLHEIGGRLTYGTPKSRASRRVVSLPSTTRSALIPVLTGRRRAEAVFTTPAGDLLRRPNFARRVWRPAVAAAGLPPVRVHDLRHTHVAWLISAGTPLTAISRRLGHASIAVTDGTYGHLLPEVDQALLGALDHALSARRADVVPMENYR